jgi:hypothetical protein
VLAGESSGDARFTVVHSFNRIAFGSQIFNHQLAHSPVIINYQHLFHIFLLQHIKRDVKEKFGLFTKLHIPSTNS